ncbi:porin [Oceanobacter mangrovi]|uniref:porin n=1 Tax=Oceanobacter mangrovi TaxID=2862510 RepID=UPI001C8D8C3E|nr:porin [Oceanobacter mangrovi]
MKKQVLALAITAVASASAFAEVENSIYGSLRLKLTTGDSAADISNDLSRIGLKGSSDTDFDGVKAIYRFEAGVGGGDTVRGDASNEANLNSRLAWVGLTSEDYGTLKVGQIWTNYYSFVGGVTDVAISLTNDTQPYFRADSTVAYVSPELSGFTFSAAVTSDTEQTTGGEGEADRYLVTASYSNGAFGVNLGMVEEGLETLEDTLGLSVTYTADALYLAALVQTKESDVDGADSRTPFELAGTYSFDDKNALAINYYDQDDEVETGYVIEFTSKIGAMSTVYANIDTAMYDGGDDTTDYTVGLKVDF